MIANAPPSPWKSPALLLSLLAATALGILAVRGLFAPVAASSSFGLAVGSPAEGGFVQVYASRNLMISALAIALVFFRQFRALALLFTFAALLPLFDMWILASRLGVGVHLIRHGVVLAVLVSIAALLWRRVAGTGRRTRMTGVARIGGPASHMEPGT